MEQFIKLDDDASIINQIELNYKYLSYLHLLQISDFMKERIYHNILIKCPGAFKYLVNQPEDLQLKFVKLDGTNIKWIINPSEEIQLIAVEKDHTAIKHIKDPSETVQLKTLDSIQTIIDSCRSPIDAKQGGYNMINEFLYNVKNPTPAVCEIIWNKYPNNQVNLPHEFVEKKLRKKLLIDLSNLSDDQITSLDEFLKFIKKT